MALNCRSHQNYPTFLQRWMPVLIRNNSCVSLHFAIGSQTEMNTKEPRLHKQSLITYPCEKTVIFPNYDDHF